VVFVTLMAMTTTSSIKMKPDGLERQSERSFPATAFKGMMPYYSSVVGARFRSLFCERSRCAPGDYEERAFTEFLYPHARLLAPVVRKLRPDFFDEDFQFIRGLASAKNGREANKEAINFQYAERARPSFLRSRLKIRVSGRKAIRSARDLFSDESSRNFSA